MTVDPGYEYVENVCRGFTWFMMETKDVVSSISLNLKNDDNELVSFNGQSVTFRLSFIEIYHIDTRVYSQL